MVRLNIGRKHGVLRTDEFEVLHHGFDGTTPVIYEDGRTKRVIGRNPALGTGLRLRIRGDVQEEICFCEIVDPSADLNLVTEGAAVVRLGSEFALRKLERSGTVPPSQKIC